MADHPKFTPTTKNTSDFDDLRERTNRSEREYARRVIHRLESQIDDLKRKGVYDESFLKRLVHSVEELKSDLFESYETLKKLLKENLRFKKEIHRHKLAFLDQENSDPDDDEHMKNISEQEYNRKRILHLEEQLHALEQKHADDQIFKRELQQDLEEWKQNQPNSNVLDKLLEENEKLKKEIHRLKPALLDHNHHDPDDDEDLDDFWGDAVKFFSNFWMDVDGPAAFAGAVPAVGFRILAPGGADPPAPVGLLNAPGPPPPQGGFDAEDFYNNFWMDVDGPAFADAVLADPPAPAPVVLVNAPGPPQEVVGARADPPDPLTFAMVLCQPIPSLPLTREEEIRRAWRRGEVTAIPKVPQMRRSRRR